MLLVTLLGAWLRTAAAQKDDSEPPIAFNITRGTLVAAIKQFVEQTDVQVTADFGGSEVQARPVDEIRESLTAEAALNRILSGSGLTAKWHSRKTVRIYPGAVAPRAYDNVDEVLVTGSRIGGGGEGPAPVRVYSREDIDRLGVSSVAGVAGYFTQQPFSMGEWSHISGAQFLQMRGLGVDTTLVLINGRRAAPSAASDTLNAFDLNSIPITAVDRIEVMSDSASAIYGADAIGGVVNIILKESIESPDVYLHYGGLAGGGEERRIAGSVGKSSERFKAALTLDYFKRGMLVGAERDIWRNQDYTRYDGVDYRVSTANPGNVYSLTNEPLPGLQTQQASVPAGSTGVLTPVDFLSTAGVKSLDSSMATWSILPDLDRKSVFGSAEFSPSKNLSIFGEVLWTSSNVVAQRSLPALMGQMVPKDNPYNPFGQAVAVDYSMVGMRPITSPSESELRRFVLGAGSKRQRWDWELVLTASDEHFDLMRINELDPSRVQAALQPNAPGGILNLFSDGPAGDPALLSSLVGKPAEFGFFSGSLQLSGFLQGELFEAPGGVSEFVAGGEWRREKVSFFDGVTVEQGIDVEQRRDVASWFAEFRLPLFDRLSVKMALRGDSYENGKDSINPQYGFVWRPTRDWLVRAAYGTSFRPPSLVELFALRSEFVMPIVDPRRGESISLARFTAGGNPDLGNVSARSITAGVTYQPSSWPGLELGVNYWQVEMDNRIISPQVSALDVLEASSPDRVTRLAPTEEDRLAGWPGAIESIDMSLLNYGRLETDGIDIDLSYDVTAKSGRLESALSATWVDEYAAQEMGSILPADRVGIANFQGTIPRWRLLGSLAWEGHGWGASTMATFTPRYRDSGPSGVLDRHLPSRTIVDLQTWFELDQVFGRGAFDELKVTVGVLNLFDREADFANVGRFFGYDVSLAKLQQRFAYIRITKAF